jgi:hypothetical protein
MNMSSKKPENELSKEADNAAHALAVVSAQKEQNLRVELPESREDAADNAAPEMREGAYAFKAGSSLPEDRLEALQVSQVFLVRYQDELYAIAADDLRAALPNLVKKHASEAGTVDVRNELTVRSAFTRNAVPELIRSVGTTNIVRYDGYFYLLPQRLGAVKWGEEDVAALPGVVVVSNSREAFAVAEGKAPARSQAKVVPKPVSKGPEKSRPVPLLRKTIGTYNIVEYEGWYYGLPHSLGPIDLQKVDVIEMPGVIRDVSANVVEREIQELLR